jgi:hypothetical protein
MLPEQPANSGAVAFVGSLREASDELRSIADQIEEAEVAGDTARVEALTGEADEHIAENLPIVPTLAIATYLSSVTDDLDSRRDLQAALEDVLQALNGGDATNLQRAFVSLQAVIEGVSVPDGETVSGVDSNLLARFGGR